MLILSFILLFVEANIALFFGVLLLNFFKLGFACLQPLELKSKHVSNERLHVDFHLQEGHLEALRCKSCQSVFYNFD